MKRRGKTITLWTVAVGLAVLVAMVLALKDFVLALYYIDVLKKARGVDKDTVIEVLASMKSPLVVERLISELGDDAAFPVPAVGIGWGTFLPEYCGGCKECFCFFTSLQGSPAESDSIWQNIWPSVALVRQGETALPYVEIALMSSAKEGQKTRYHWLEETLVRMGKAAVPFILANYEKSPGWGFRMLACIGPEAREAIPFLTHRLSVSPQDECVAVLVALGAIGPAARGAAAEIVMVLKGANDQRMRCFAAGAIYKIAGWVVDPHEGVCHAAEVLKRIQGTQDEAGR